MSSIELLYKFARKSNLEMVEAIQPNDLKHAYELQKINSEYLSSIGGWKLGGTTELTRRLFNTQNTYYGVLDSNVIFNASEEIKLPEKINHCVGEVEVCFRLSKKAASINQYNLEKSDVNIFIDAVMPSIELPWSNFQLPDEGLNVLIADSCAAGALIVGNPIPWNDQSEELLRDKVRLNCGDMVLAEGEIENIIDGPVQALKEFLLLAKEHQLELKQGHLVATGGCTPCVPLPLNDTLTVSFELLGSFSFKMKGNGDEG